MLLKEIASTEGNMEYKIYCDLDGVLFDFVDAVRKIVPDYTDEKYQNTPGYRNKMWKAIGRYTKEGGLLWQNLDLMPDAMILWDYISRYPNTEILTATGDPSLGSGVQKKIAVQNHFGNVPIHLVRTGAEKHKFAAPNHILIDDMEKSIGPWVQAGGIGILHKNAANTIQQLKRLGL